MREFNTKLLSSGHSVIIGDGKVKDKLVSEILRKHEPSGGALLVLDYDGKYYESYEGNAMLADFSSMESVFPNILETMLHSKKYGADIKTFSVMMQKLLAHSKPDRGSNDAFWSTMGAAAFRSYIEYLCAIYKIERRTARRGIGDDRHDLALIGQHASKMTEIMHGVTIGVPRGERDDREFLRDPLYKAIERYVQRQYGKDAKPFDNTLRNPGLPVCGTYQSIYMSMLSIGDSFFKLIELFEEKGETFSALPQLDMKEFVTGQSVPLYVCGTQSQQANQALGTLILMASAVAAHDADASVTVVIPELERWNLGDTLSYVKGESLNGLSTITSVSDLRELASLTGMDKRGALAALAETSGKMLWLYSTETVCEELFEANGSAKARSYRLNELGEQFAAYQEAGKEPEYLVLPEWTRNKPGKAKTRTPIEDEIREPWIDRLSEEEREEINEQLYGGLPEDLFFDLAELGFIEEINGDADGCSDSFYKNTEHPFATEALCTFLMSDEKRLSTKERRILDSAPDGNYFLARTLAGHGLKVLAKRCRAIIKNEAELEGQTLSEGDDRRNADDDADSSDGTDGDDDG